MMTRKRLILIALPTIIAAIILIVILNLHIPTRVRITLTGDRMSFKIGGEHKATILDTVGLKSVVVEKFQTITLKPQTLSLLKLDGISSSSQTVISSLARSQLPIVITPRGGRSQSNVIFASDDSDPRATVLIDALTAQPSTEISLERTEDLTDLILRVDGQRSSGNIAIGEPFRLDVDQSQIANSKNSLELIEPLAFNVKLNRDSPVEFVSQERSLILTVTVTAEKSTALLPQGHILISSIRFEQLDEQSGNVVSSLTRDTACEISYPDYEGKIEKATLTRPDLLWLDDLRNFSIEELTYDPGKKGISVKLLGVAGKVSSGSLEYARDHRLTVYDAVWNNHKIAAGFAVLCWVAGTTVAFMKFLKEQ